MGDEKENFVLDAAIIENIQAHPLLYDKGLEEYHKQYRDERPKVLKNIAEELSGRFNIDLDEHKLWNRWMNLVKKFKSEKKTIDEKQPSGSAASEKISSWVFYNDMVWIVPYVEHLTQLSSDNLQEGDSQKQQHGYKKKSSKSSSDEQVHSMEQMIEQNAALIEQIGKSLEGSGDNNLIDSYFPLIAMRHSLVPKDRQYNCTKEVLSYIQFFVNKKKAIGN
ncbi:hypothetical protein QAD02_015383 [Eretmocerus hayati]|uniref:Uncharacterized protein n=2 Tax=Eretmocerus hayati TaxID=131215 RepID=A0ACC2NST6_9HYME|nr:hypothetical protein QAD02_005155 [Eretmocerus hayati]KAJ8679596.1 hypothetical protein QAD02_015383 [Eretmocerus hayati]